MFLLFFLVLCWAASNRIKCGTQLLSLFSLPLLAIMTQPVGGGRARPVEYLPLLHYSTGWEEFNTGIEFYILLLLPCLSPRALGNGSGGHSVSHRDGCSKASPNHRGSVPRRRL